MYHVEMRAGMTVARAFNLADDELRTRFLTPLLAGREFVHEGHEWTPRQTRLKIYDGRRLEPHELSLGRGWQNVERTATDVTLALLGRAGAGAGRDALQQRILERLSDGPVGLGELGPLVLGDPVEARRVSEQLAACELAVWELLHTGSARLEVAGVAVAREEWEAVILGWTSWLGGGGGANVRLVAA